MEQNKENKESYGIIYKIENTVNRKVYIGQTVNSFNGRYWPSGEGIERVYKYHKYLKEHNRHYNVHLLGAIEKYGFEAFTIDKEFDVAYSKEELNDLEKKYIKEFDCINNGYNNKEGGSDGKYSEEVCKKISESLKGKLCGKNHPMYGKHHTEETRLKQSEAHKGKNCGENHYMYGKQHSEDVRRKMSESLKGKNAGKNNPMYGVHRYGENSPNYGNHKLAGKNHPMYGKHRTEEERRKISETLKGKLVGENHPNARKVICLNDSKIFNTVKECAEYYKLNANTIINICKGITKKSRTGLVFMYYDEYLQQQEQQDQAVI